MIGRPPRSHALPPRRAGVRRNAGAVPLSLHRTGTGSASHNGAHYATLILSGAHPHGLRSKMSGSRTRHTFWNYGHPSGFDRIAFCQLGGRARERGLSCGQRGRFTGGRSALAPAPAGRPPMRKAYHVKPSVCFQVFSRQTASRSRLAILIAGEPPETRFPWAASFNPSAGSGFKPAANPSPHS